MGHRQQKRHLFSAGFHEKQVRRGKKCGMLRAMEQRGFQKAPARRNYLCWKLESAARQLWPSPPKTPPRAMGSGTLEVFATPALAALAEKTCWESVAPALEPGTGTVGTELSLEHTAPTPVGMHVTCDSELIAVDGRKLTFEVTLRDEKGQVGHGMHQRFVIDEKKFFAKAQAKLG